MILNFTQLIDEAKKKVGVVVGVPSPEDSSSIKSVIKAKTDNIADFILTGNKEKITGLFEPIKNKT